MTFSGMGSLVRFVIACRWNWSLRAMYLSFFLLFLVMPLMVVEWSGWGSSREADGIVTLLGRILVLLEWFVVRRSRGFPRLFVVL